MHVYNNPRAGFFSLKYLITFYSRYYIYLYVSLHTHYSRANRGATSATAPDHCPSSLFFIPRRFPSPRYASVQVWGSNGPGNIDLFRPRNYKTSASPAAAELYVLYMNLHKRRAPQLSLVLIIIVRLSTPPHIWKKSYRILRFCL